MACLALIVFVVLGSALGVFLERVGLKGLSLAMLSPTLVTSGEVWRMLTWGFFEPDGQNLIFGALMLAIFGRDLGGLWGGARYLVICALVVAGTGLLTVVTGLGWGEVRSSDYLSIWPLVDSLIVAWALLFPSRTILFMFMLPMAGRNLLYMTLGITVLFAIMHGFANFVPHLLAMGLMYAYIRGGTAVAAQLKLNRLLAPKRQNPGFKVFEGGGNKDGGKNPNGSGWVH